MSEERLARIEVKLDEIAKAMTLLARLEERQAYHADGFKRVVSEMDDLKSRVSMAERRLDAGSVKIGYGERVMWVIVSSAIAAWSWFEMRK